MAYPLFPPVKFTDVLRRQLLLSACRALLPLAIATGVAANPQPATPRQTTEVFSGGGRACTGNLTIRDKTIDWQTPFSQCTKQPYTLIQEKDIGVNHLRVFALNKPSKKCLYQFIVLETPLAGGQALASGFQTRQDYEQQDYPHGLGCPMLSANRKKGKQGTDHQ